MMAVAVLLVIVMTVGLGVLASALAQACLRVLRNCWVVDNAAYCGLRM